MLLYIFANLLFRLARSGQKDFSIGVSYGIKRQAPVHYKFSSHQREWTESFLENLQDCDYVLSDDATFVHFGRCIIFIAASPSLHLAEARASKIGDEGCYRWLPPWSLEECKQLVAGVPELEARFGIKFSVDWRDHSGSSLGKKSCGQAN